MGKQQRRAYSKNHNEFGSFEPNNGVIFAGTEYPPATILSPP
jgi:hypothetical protein